MSLSEATADREVAVEWFETFPVVGIEGLVVKGAVQAYPAGRREW
ncbi:hypothetical protein ACO229_02745 [Promicromonospora sp. MS192]